MNLRTIREETLMKTALYPYNLTQCIRPAHRLIAWCAPLFLLLALGQSAAVAATVSTDQADYPPGSTAYITGSGFLAGETVQCQVLHADGTPSTGADHDPWPVVADDAGGFQTTWHVCEDDCVGSTLELTATGQTSGLIAQTRFTDASSADMQVVSNSDSPDPVAAGANITYTI